MKTIIAVLIVGCVVANAAMLYVVYDWVPAKVQNAYVLGLQTGEDFQEMQCKTSL